MLPISPEIAERCICAISMFLNLIKCLNLCDRLSGNLAGRDF